MEKYLLHEKVGEGLLGEVFKAVHIDTKQICAIKIVHLDQPPEDPEDVQKELNFLKTCDSQHLIKYYETLLQDDTLYLVMEFVTPGSLKDYLMKVGPVSETYISMILREMLLGLEYLQSERRCHRNLKASNVLLSDKGEVKLCDLVVGGSLGDATRLESVSRAPYWIAPEVMSGNPKVEKLDKQDIWSIGITAYEIATGMTPYHNHEPMKMNLLLARGDPPRLEGEFSRSFKDFVNLCLNKEVKKRPSIKELLTHPFIRKSKKIYNLLDMVGKLHRQQQRLSQRVLDSSAVAPAVGAHPHSPKSRGRAFSTSAVTSKLRDGSDEGSGNELGGALSYGRTHSPSFDSGSGSGPKIGVTMSRLKSEGGSKFGSLGRLTSALLSSSSSSSASSSSSTTTSTSSSSTTRPATSAPTSAFTPTTPTATPFAPTTTAIPPTTTSSTTSSTSGISKSTELKQATTSPSTTTTSTTPTSTTTTTTTTSEIKKPEVLPLSPSLSSSTPAITVSNVPPSTTPLSASTPAITVNPPQEPAPAATSTLASSSSTLIPPPSPAALVSSGSNENINESDFPSFINALSPPHTPKVKTPLLTTPPTSSFLDTVILPVLAKKGRSYTDETSGVLTELKELFKRLEQSHAGACQQLVNDWVEAVLWENYTQPERGSPMANYLLLRWKNGTPL